jgi:hypothetical protein
MNRDDRGSLLLLGALAWLSAMLLHEAVGHGLLCLAEHQRALVTLTATQCTGSALVMVMAGPGWNIFSGVVALLVLPGLRRTAPPLRWYGWLFTACNLLIAGGYMIVGGVANFGDWSALSAEVAPSWPARVLEVVAGAGLYYAAIQLLARQLPTTDGDRLHRLTRLPYLGAGLVAVAAGLINPIGIIPSLILPALSSFGGLIGLVLMDTPADHATGEMELVAISKSWQAIGWLFVALTSVIFGRGLRL